ncbi:MAG: nucleoside triphosphate pyrophosphohydrolase [Candidatus Acidiferrales bacterium]|jgi:MazG family protein
MLRRQENAGKRPARKQPKPRVSSRAHIEVRARDKAAGKWFAKLVALQARLRGPTGCPWDREQTHQSLRKFLIEEAYEVLDAMDSGNPEEFASELGDLLLQVTFHAILAEEACRFTISDVIESVHAKMVRRHPHVFGDVTAKTPAAVLKNWEQIKRDERAEEGRAREDSLLGGVPRSLPAVLEAYQLTRRASRIGFDWENLGGILDKLEEEKSELKSLMPPTGEGDPGRAGRQARHVEEEIGDLFFVCVNIARFLGVDPEIALKKTNRKFKRRFQWMESAAEREGRRLADLPRARMEELWNQSKAHD